MNMHYQALSVAKSLQFCCKIQSQKLETLGFTGLLDDCSNTTVNITICIVLNISSDVLFYKLVHFVIIISISKVFQVQNKPMGFLPPIQMKGLITMKLIHAEYNPMHNSIDINH